MPSKGTVWILVLLGSILGGYIPSLWGAVLFSLASIITSALGGLFGLWLAFKLSG